MLKSFGPHWCALLDEYGLRGSWDDVSASRSWMVAAVRAGTSRHQAVAHPFNPPHLVPLVEILGGADGAVERAIALYRRLGRHPIVMRR